MLSSLVSQVLRNGERHRKVSYSRAATFNGKSGDPLMILAGTMKADFITSQVTCVISTGESVTATNFCSVAGDFATSASAAVTASFALPTSPGPLSLVSNEQGFAKGYWDGVTGLSALFSESLSIQLTLDTPGNPRPGFFLISGGTSIVSGSYDTSFSGSIFGLDPRSLPLRQLPITLGEPFTFTYTRSMSCFDNALNLVCVENNVALSQYDFHLYEADGVTPVLITLAAPEPSSATLLFLSLSGLSLVRWRQVKREWLVIASPAPSRAPTTTSLRKCMPSRIREVAIKSAHRSSAGRSAG